MATVQAPQVKKNKLGSLITPAGDALFVSAPNPSKFDENKIEASIVLSAEDFAVLQKEIDAKLDELVTSGEVLVCDRKLAALKVMKETDKDGNETGRFVVKSKTGIQYAPKYYNNQNKTFVPDANFIIPNRSKIRLAVSVELCSSAMYKGLTLKLNGIKIISMPSFGNSAFDGVEDSDGDFDYGNAAPVAIAQDLDWAE